MRPPIWGGEEHFMKIGAVQKWKGGFPAGTKRAILSLMQTFEMP
jgi:hypothetical protein